jgi:acetate kinase
MKVLALNSGSSSIKYRLFDAQNNFQLLKREIAERIGQKDSPFPNHHQAMQALFGDQFGFVIDAVGHRIVHGGEQFKGPTLITADVLKDIKELALFAPLHSEPNIVGIEVLQELLPNIPHIAVFDTSTHASMDSKAFLYGIPLEYYEKYKIRKYGFHGINHAYVAQEAAKLIKKPLEALKLITCHLGNGCSISAFKEGKSIDNSMGLTPLEGLVMGTRCGDLDPSVVIYLVEKLGLQIDEVKELLNRKSGLLGLCGKSDMRDIMTMAQAGDKRAQIAIETFVYRIQKYIGAYAAALNGVDAIVFTGGIGENSPDIRTRIMKNFSYLGPHINVLTIPANEELAIAQQTYQLVSQS